MLKQLHHQVDKEPPPLCGTLPLQDRQALPARGLASACDLQLMCQAKPPQPAEVPPFQTGTSLLKT